MLYGSGNRGPPQDHQAARASDPDVLGKEETMTCSGCGQDKQIVSELSVSRDVPGGDYQVRNAMLCASCDAKIGTPGDAMNYLLRLGIPRQPSRQDQPVVRLANSVT
jgi:hypothetical protein